MAPKISHSTHINCNPKTLRFRNQQIQILKSSMAQRINQIITKKQWTCQEAGVILGATRAHVSNLRHGKIHSFSLDRLMGYLVLLGNDVKIIMKPIAKGSNKMTHNGKMVPKGRVNLEAKK